MLHDQFALSGVNGGQVARWSREATRLKAAEPGRRRALPSGKSHFNTRVSATKCTSDLTSSPASFRPALAANPRCTIRRYQTHSSTCGEVRKDWPLLLGNRCILRTLLNPEEMKGVLETSSEITGQFFRTHYVGWAKDAGLNYRPVLEFLNSAPWKKS